MAKIGEELGAHDPQHFKFTAIVGNPPYQETVESDTTATKSIYPVFLDKAVSLSDVVSMVMPARWIGGSNGSFGATKGMVARFKSYGVKSLHLFINSSDVFDGVDVKGGICYFTLQRGYSGETNYELTERVSDLNGNATTKTRSVKRTLDNRIDNNVIIIYPTLDSISSKVDSYIRQNNGCGLADLSVSSLVSAVHPFKFATNFFTNNKEGVSRISELKESSDDYRILGLINNKRTFKFIPNSAVHRNIAGAKAYKVFLPKANGSGALGEVFSSPMLGEPMLVCTCLLYTSDAADDIL